MKRLSVRPLKVVEDEGDRSRLSGPVDERREPVDDGQPSIRIALLAMCNKVEKTGLLAKRARPDRREEKPEGTRLLELLSDSGMNVVPALVGEEIGLVKESGLPDPRLSLKDEVLGTGRCPRYPIEEHCYLFFASHDRDVNDFAHQRASSAAASREARVASSARDDTPSFWKTW
jgi:hypothetical protein